MSIFVKKFSLKYYIIIVEKEWLGKTLSGLGNGYVSREDYNKLLFVFIKYLHSAAV